MIVGTSVKPELTSNPVHHRYHESNIARGRWPGQLRLRSRYRDRVSGWFDYLLIESEGLDGILRDSGWRRGFTFDQDECYATVIASRLTRLARRDHLGRETVGPGRPLTLKPWSTWS